MDTIQNNCQVRCLIEQRLKMLDRFFLRQIQPKLFLDLLVHVTMLDIRNIGVHHQSYEVEDEVCALAQNGESSEAELLNRA